MCEMLIYLLICLFMQARCQEDFFHINNLNDVKELWNREINKDVKLTAARYGPTHLEFKLTPTFPGIEWYDVIYTKEFVANLSFDSVWTSKNTYSGQTKNNKIVLKGLEPKTKYSVCVIKNKHDSLEICNHFSTAEDLEHVEYLRILSRSETEMVVGWDPPEKYGRAGSKLNYIVIVKNKDTDYEDFNFPIYEKNSTGNVTNQGNAKLKYFNPTVPKISLQLQDVENKEICVKIKSSDSGNSKKWSFNCIESSVPYVEDVAVDENHHGSAIITWVEDPSTTGSQSYSLKIVDDAHPSCYEDTLLVRNGTVFPIPKFNVNITFLLYDDALQEVLVGKTTRLFYTGESPQYNPPVITRGKTFLIFDLMWPTNHSKDPLSLTLRSNKEVTPYILRKFIGCQSRMILWNLTEFTKYYWTMEGDGNVNLFFSGENKTEPGICEPVTNLTVEVEKFGSNRSAKPVFKWKMPEKINGEFEKCKVTISGDRNKISPNKYDYEKVCNAEGCRVAFEDHVYPGRNYNLYVACKNKEPNIYGRNTVLRFTTDSAVPVIAIDALQCAQIAWNQLETNAIKISINRGNLDSFAGQILSLEVYYDLIDKFVAPNPLNDYLDNLKRKNHSEKLSYGQSENKPIELNGGATEFTLKELQFGEVYYVIMKYKNQLAFSHSSKLVFRVPDYSWSGSTFFTLMTLLLLVLWGSVAYLSHRSYQKKLWKAPTKIPFVPWLPDEGSKFHIPVAKETWKESFLALTAHSKSELRKQYQYICECIPKYSSSIARLPENTRKNRYTDIIPYNYSRVILADFPGMPTATYINASYIHGYEVSCGFIACQGPMESTTIDFWRMIWDENVETIVMLTKCVERNAIFEKCHEYWPSITNSNFKYGDIFIKPILESEDASGDFTIRKFQLTKDWIQREVRHFHYTTWPDQGCPKSAQKILPFVYEVRRSGKFQNSPIVVHCSAGIGRTGTFIAVYNLMDEIADESKTEVDIMYCVTKMRCMRDSMVQNVSQYIFIYDCVNQIFKEKSGEINEPDNAEDLLSEIEIGQNESGSLLDVSEDDGLEPLSDDDDDTNSTQKFNDLEVEKTTNENKLQKQGGRRE